MNNSEDETKYQQNVPLQEAFSDVSEEADVVEEN